MCMCIQPLSLPSIHPYRSILHILLPDILNSATRILVIESSILLIPPRSDPYRYRFFLQIDSQSNPKQPSLSRVVHPHQRFCSLQDSLKMFVVK
ncbi:unnamed protein product [Caenorhabditis nigoni]